MMPEPDTYRAGVRPRTRDVPALKDDRTTNAKHTTTNTTYEYPTA